MKFLLCVVALATFLFAVDINTASVKELVTLKGIGEKKAKAIVEYRNTIKCFKSIEEIKKVKGIGDSFLVKNQKELTISPCKS